MGEYESSKLNLFANETLYQLSYDPIPPAMKYAKALDKRKRKGDWSWEGYTDTWQVECCMSVSPLSPAK